jgi:flagellar biosynthesis/type III secretory pathway M-ring protein FliF/YscJ
MRAPIAHGLFMVMLLFVAAPAVAAVASARHADAARPIPVEQQRRLNREREAQVEARLLSLLSKVFGQGRSSVQVKIDLDFSSTNGNRRVAPPMSEPEGDAEDEGSQGVVEPIQSHVFSLRESLEDDGPGRIKHMAVLVEVQGLPADRVDDLRQIVMAVSGADVAHRGDTITVRGVKFDDAQPRVLKDLLEVEEPTHEKK